MLIVRRLSRLVLVVALLLVSLAFSFPVHAQEVPKNPPASGGASLQSAQILSSPLDIQVNNDLSIGFDLFGYNMYFADYDAGTYLVLNGVVYGPQPTANQGFQPLQYTLVSHTTGGNGTASEPAYITTKVTAGTTGVQLTQTVTYVAGDYKYNTFFHIENTSSNQYNISLIYAADMYANFADNYVDYGYGFHNPVTGVVGLVSYGLLNMQVITPNPAFPPDAYQVSDWGRSASVIPFWRYIGGASGAAGPGLANFAQSGYYDVVAGLQWNRVLSGAVAAPNAETSAASSAIDIGFGGGFGDQGQIGVPNPLAQQQEEEVAPADISVVQRTNPSIATTQSGIVTYTITATNRGQGNAKETAITMPLDPAKVRVLDASFSRNGAWVSNLASDSVEIKTGPLGGNGDTVTATLRLQVLPDVPVGTSLSGRLSYHWWDYALGGDDVSNASLLSVESSVRNPDAYPLAADPAEGAAGTTFTFHSELLAPREPVGVWYNTPDGQAVTVSTSHAGDDGSLSVTLNSSGLAPGNYSLVFRGLWTGLTAVTPFTVQGSASS
jgi:hypothetical protein